MGVRGQGQSSGSMTRERQTPLTEDSKVFYPRVQKKTEVAELSQDKNSASNFHSCNFINKTWYYQCPQVFGRANINLFQRNTTFCVSNSVCKQFCKFSIQHTKYKQTHDKTSEQQNKNRPTGTLSIVVTKFKIAVLRILS